MNDKAWKIHNGKPVYGAESSPSLIEIQNQDPLDPRCVAWVHPDFVPLVVSAPDLLEACNAVVESMKSAPVLETDWKLPGSYKAWKLCVNAIQKAEGAL